MHSADTNVGKNNCFSFSHAGATFGSTTWAKRGALTLAALSALLVFPALARAQTETVLYSFCARPGCTDGSNPLAGLVLDGNGNLYGTTYHGGANAKGTVFEVSGSGSETVLYSFCAQSGCKDGYHPEAGLILDANGNLYGTTYDGGAHAAGTVFEVSGSGTETVLYSFCVKRHCSDGYYPHAGLVRDNNGNLYGTTQFNGAYGGGTVFELSASGTETVLYSFCAQPSCTDGSGPRAGLVLDTNGNLYGTTYGGGAYGGGTVFKVSASGTETVLHSFCAQAGCKDGSNPLADLVMDANGNLFGTTIKGGTNGKGTVFEVSANGSETVLYSFCSQAGCRDGSTPKAGLVMDTKGNLYGTTYYGGAKRGRGTVFELSASGTETVLHSFSANGTDGYNPVAGLVLDDKGNLYGTTLVGGANKGGTVFEVTP